MTPHLAETTSLGAQIAQTGLQVTEGVDDERVSTSGFSSSRQYTPHEHGLRYSTRKIRTADMGIENSTVV